MKKRVKGIKKLLLLTTILTILFSSHTVLAAEQFNDLSGEIKKGSFFNSFAAEHKESVNSATEDTELPVFLLVVDYEGEKDFMHAFYVEDTYGTGGSYLISSLGAYVFADEGASLYVVAGGEVKEAEFLGIKDGLSYLTFDGLEDYTPFSLKESITSDVMYFIMIEVDDNGKFVQEAYRVEMDSSWEKEDGYYATGLEADSLIYLGVPSFDENSYELVGMFEAEPDTGEMLIIDMTQVAYESSYAVVSGTPVQHTETEAPAEEPVQQPHAEEAPVEEAPAEESEAQGTEPVSGFLSTVPGWAYAAIAVLIVGAVYVSGNQKKKGKYESKPEQQAENAEYPKEGTIALNKKETQMSEGTIVNEPPKAKWQVRGMGGMFEGKTFALTDTLRFGRNPQNQIVYSQNTKGISGNHCELSMENERIILRDLGSTYGTFLEDGSKLNERVAYEVKEGDIFYLAESAQSFRIEQIGESRQVFTPAVKAAMYPKAGETYRADAGGKIQFGRSAHCQVSFGANDTKISTNHCVLYKENGVLYLKDLGSTNGTFFAENKRLQPNVPYQAEKGMAFYLTSQNYLFVITED